MLLLEKTITNVVDFQAIVLCLQALAVVAFTQSLMLIGAYRNLSNSGNIEFLGVAKLTQNKDGDFTILQKKKKQEIIEENKHQVTIPPKVGEEEKKALEQTGDDTTSGW